MKKSDFLKNNKPLSIIVEKLIQTFHPEAVYLFGSKARGNSGPDSDYDLMVIVSHSSEPGYRRAVQAHEALGAMSMAVDVVVVTRDEFERKKTVIGTLPETVVYEGQELYAA